MFKKEICDFFSLDIDQFKAFAFEVDDVDRAQSQEGYLEIEFDEAKTALAEDADKYVGKLAKGALSNMTSASTDISAEASPLATIDAGLIKLADEVGITPTVKDIVENPKNLEVVELVAQQLPLSLADAEIAVINNGVAVQANLSPLNDSIYIENTESESVVNYYNIIAARTEDKDNPTLKRLVEVYQTEETKKAIEEEYKGASIPVFE